MACSCQIKYANPQPALFHWNALHRYIDATKLTPPTAHTPRFHDTACAAPCMCAGLQHADGSLGNTHTHTMSSQAPSFDQQRSAVALELC